MDLENLCVYYFRFQKQNILLGGMWFAKSKPLMNVFLKPIVDDINSLYNTGIFSYLCDNMSESHISGTLMT